MKAMDRNIMAGMARWVAQVLASPNLGFAGNSNGGNGKKHVHVKRAPKHFGRDKRRS